MNVGFIGLGQMGAGMAANLLRVGHSVTVYNRTASKQQELVHNGAHAADQVADACPGEAVITMLADDGALEDVAYGEKGLIKNMKKDAVHICMATISVSLSKRLAERHAEAGHGYVAAPVFGRPDAAAAAMLFIVAAGEPDVIHRCQPLFDAMGQETFVIGDQPQMANLVKLSGNFLLASVIEGLSEAMALIEKAGIDRHQYLNLLTSTLFSAPVYKIYGGLMADRKFEPAGFAVPLGLKDIRMALTAAEELCVPMPLASLLRDRLLSLLAQGGEKRDWAAVAQLAAQDAGISQR
ncbi:MAG: NAD(P)-dependent oxidoreductase [Thermodesulfobacteriota bacterium]